MIRINLLPVRAAKKKESARMQVTIAVLITLFVAAISLLVYSRFAGELAQIKNDIATAESELNALKARVGELAKLKDQKRVLEDKLKIVRELESARSGPVRTFTKISESVPEKAWIETFEEKGRSLTIQGFAAYDDVIADFMRRLKANGFSPVELEVAQRDTKRGNGMELVSFTLKIEKPKSGPEIAKP
jgi:type IV pilus assembly protein PilN